MWITLCLVTLVWISKTQAGEFCDEVLNQCRQGGGSWTRCYEARITSCTPRKRDFSLLQLRVNSSQEAEGRLFRHRVHVPSSALKMSKGADEEVLLVVTVINSTLFQLSPAAGRGRGRARTAAHSPHRPGVVLDQLVLVVKAGHRPVRNLSEPIKLTFKHNLEVEDGTCVFWQESDLEDGTGRWCTDGCGTSNTGTEFICSCNHMSFFAVLVNPVLAVEKSNAATLSYITYIGSALSVLFLVFTLIIYTRLYFRRRPEKAISVHMHLAGSLFCLHLSFLLCSLWVRILNVNEEGWICRGLGLVLHWSLLAAFSWMALEGFHLYLLLVRVFNIYISRYLLKLSLVGWGLPTLIVVICGIFGVYGKYSLELRGYNSHNSTAQICWMSSQFPQRILVSYITTVAFPCLVVLFNTCMVGLVVFRLFGLRKQRGSGSSSAWKKMSKDKGTKLWKDGATVLGLSCLLGLPWGLASSTYISLPGIYLFTILNSLQGMFIFLWSVGLSCKTQPENNSSVRDSSSQKLMTTSFNN